MSTYRLDVGLRISTLLTLAFSAALLRDVGTIQ
jgi:hypothetical protein